MNGLGLSVLPYLSLAMICGIDEAGRGPVIGPLVIAGVLASEEDSEALKNMGVKDSKKIGKNTRSKLYKQIKEKHQTYSIKVSPLELDNLRKKMTLNKIEAIKFAEIINKLKPEKAYVDAADVVPENFKKAIRSEEHTSELQSHSFISYAVFCLKKKKY